MNALRKLKIWQKVLLAILLTNVLLMATMIVSMRWFYDREFLNYVKTTRLSFLGLYSKQLREHFYDPELGWQQTKLEQRPNPKLQRKNNPRTKGQRFAKHQSKGKKWPKKLPENLEDFFLLAQDWRKLRLALTDASDDLVSGDGEITESPVKIEIPYRDQIIGYLYFRPIKEPLDEEFAEQQARALYLISLLALIVVSIISILLAQNLLEPIRLLKAGTKSLTQGEFKKRINVASQDELGQLAADFNTLAETLEEAEQSRRRWVADISHELRTPVAILRAEIEALQDGIRSFDKNTAESLSNEINYLNTLINDLYTLSLSDAGSLSYDKKSFNITELLESILHRFEDRFSQNGIAVETNLTRNITVFGDTQRIAQLLSNILENSLRYTNDPGKIIVSCKRYQQDVVIQVEDSAPGVDPAAISKLFDRLYRVDESRNRKYGGAGLGLAICKNIVAAHNGSICADPSELGGLKIRISLPVAPDEHE